MKEGRKEGEKQKQRESTLMFLLFVWLSGRLGVDFGRTLEEGTEKDRRGTVFLHAGRTIHL